MMHRLSAPLLNVGLLLTLAVTTACGAHQLREAQDVFNRAASTENANRLGSVSPDGGLLADQSAVNDYKFALGLTREALADHGDDLLAENLYGTAKVLEVLSLWRLADLDGAEEYANEFDREISALQRQLDRDLDTPETRAFGTRDRVLIKALPALRDHDKGLRAKEWAKANEFFESAFSNLGASIAAGGAPEEHPIVIYVRLAQLSACRSWQAAAFRLSANDQEAADRSQRARRKFIDTLNELKPAWRKNPELRAQLKRFIDAMGVSYDFR